MFTNVKGEGVPRAAHNVSELHEAAEPGPHGKG